MTKITEQLESLNQDELKFIHSLFVEAVENSRKEMEGIKNMSSFINAMNDLTKAYFPVEGETQILNQAGMALTGASVKEESKEAIQKLEEANLLYTNILNKLTPLIEIINETE